MLMEFAVNRRKLEPSLFIILIQARVNAVIRYPANNNERTLHQQRALTASAEAVAHLARSLLGPAGYTTKRSLYRLWRQRDQL